MEELTREESEPMVGYEGIVLESAVEDHLVLFSVQKMWFKAEPVVGVDKYAAGYVLTPPYGKEIVIAVPLDSDPVTVPVGTLSFAEFEKVVDRMVASMRRVRTVAEDKGGF